MWLAIFIAIVTFLLYRYGGGWRPNNFPPGSVGIPVLVNMLQLGIQSYKVAQDNEKQCGAIQGYRLASTWTVILNDPEDIREAFSRPEFSGRPHYNWILDARQEDANYGVVYSGDKWQRLRRFSLKTLRDFGFVKRTSERIILEEVRDLMKNFRKSAGQPFENKNVFNTAVLNVTWSILTGQPYNQSNERMRRLMTLINKFFEEGVNGIAIVIFLCPWIGNIRQRFPRLFPTPPGVPLRRELFKIFRETIEEHQATIERGHPRDFIDCMLQESEEESFDEIDILDTLLDVFLVGSETTSTTLMWTLFFLAKNPKVQEKLVAEIQAVVGTREVCLDDRPNLPYVDATTQEICRAATLTPNGIPHVMIKDIRFKGYDIPEGTVVFPNIYACHFSRKIWGDPENFRPERFLEMDGFPGKEVHHKAWLPFGVGKRSCMGEALTSDAFFLFLTNILQKFKVDFPPDEPPHSMMGRMHGSIRYPETHRIVLYNRYT